MIQAVLFDMDGLMFDTESVYSLVHKQMSKKRGKAFTLEIKSTLMGKRAHEVMLLLNEYWDKKESTADLLREQDVELIRLYRLKVEKMPGLEKLLQFLSAHNIRKCIGTSSRKSLVDVLLKNHKLEDQFEFIVSGDMVERGKPYPDIYNACIRHLDLPSNRCLVLEDSFNGIQSGKSAGCLTCAIPSVFTKHEDFQTADIVATSLDDYLIESFIKKSVP